MINFTQPDNAIQTHETRRSEHEHLVDSVQLLIFTFLLILVILTIWLFKHKKISYIHETGLALFYGAIFGAIIRFGISSSSSQAGPNKELSGYTNLTLNNISKLPEYIYLDISEHSDHTFIYGYMHPKRNDSQRVHFFENKASFSTEIFFNVLLPPIIFNAGYSLKRKNFFKNVGAILMYAFIGTTISCLTIGGMIGALLTYFVKIPYFSFTDCFFFGAIISATDPVTTLTIFNDANVDLDMYSLVFGESVLNDVVSIILAQQIEKYAQPTSEHFSTLNFFEALGNFTSIFGVSILIGCFMGFFNALLTKFTDIRQHADLETALFALMSYTTFLAAETVGASGIVAVLLCGICQAHYTFKNLSDESKIQTKQIFNLLSFLSENFIFVYIGVTLLTFREQHWNTWFIITAFVAIFIGRLLNVYPLSFLINLTRTTRRKITFNMQNMLFFSGLRGAMAFSLAIRNTSTEARQLILTTTSIIVTVTVLFNGGLTQNMLHWLKIKTEQEDPKEEGEEKKSFIQRLLFKYAWHDFDNSFMKPLLTNSQITLMDTLPKFCLPVSRLLTSKEQMYANQKDSYLMRGRDEMPMEDVIFTRE